MKTLKHKKKTSKFCNRSRLNINELSLFVHLGCFPKEKASLQEVRLSIEIEFPTEPHGETTDCLKDTLCYDEICKTIKDYIKGRQFNLIEKMARECLTVLHKKYPSVSIRITLYKKTPPVEGLKGGVKYSCEEGFS